MKARTPRIQEKPLGLWTAVRVAFLAGVFAILDLAVSFSLHFLEKQGLVDGWLMHFLDGFASATLISAVFIFVVLPIERRIWKRRERELLESHEHQEELWESLDKVIRLSLSGIALISRDGTVLRYNDAFRELVHGTAEPLEGQRLSELLPLEGLAPFLAEAIEGRDVLHDGSFELLTQKGRKFLRVQCLPTTPLLHEGAVLLVRIADETLAWQRAEEIKQNEARLSTIVEEQTELVGRFTSDHRLVFANQAFRDFYGLGERPLPQGPFERPVDEMDREWVEAKRRQLGPRCPYISYWHRAPGPDGTSRSLDWTERASFDEKERLVEYQAVGRDKTRQYEAIESLKESERQVNFILDSAPVLIWMADVRGNGTFFNKGWLDFTGRSLEEELGDGWTASVHAEDLPSMLDDFREAVAGRHSFRFEFRFRRRDGVFRWILDRGIPLISEAGDLTGYIGCFTDTTLLKEAETALRETGEINHLIVENVRDGVIVHDENLRIVLWNPMMEEITGLKARDVLGRRALDPFPFLVETGLFSLLENALSGGSLLGREDPFYIPASGKSGWVSSTFVPLRDAGGKIKGVLATVHDVTRERQAREALEASSNLYRGMFETNNAVKFLVDPESGQIVDANPAAIAFYGFGREQLLSMSVFDLNQLSRAEIQQELTLAAKNQKAYFVFPHRLSNGEARQVEVWSGPVEIKGRSLLFSIVHDISDRVRAEQNLQRSEARFRAIFDHAGLGIAVAGEGRLIVQANRALEEMLGYPSGGLGGMRPADFTFPGDIPAERHFFAELVAGKRESFRIEKRYIRKDGSLVWGDVSITLLRDQSGEPEFVVAMIQDITQRREAIDALQRSKESLRALSSRLLSIQEEERRTLARELHDGLGQSLTGLSYGLSWVAKRIGAEQKDVSERISALKNDIGATIAEVRYLSRHLRPASLDLGLAEALESEAAAFERRTEIRTHCEMKPIPDLDAPRATALFRIAQEALTNIARHAEAKEARITLSFHEGHVLLEIADDGKGFAPAALSSPDALGILGARERAAAFEGTVYLSQNKPRGTRLIVQMPVPPAEDTCSRS